MKVELTDVRYYQAHSQYQMKVELMPDTIRLIPRPNEGRTDARYHQVHSQYQMKVELMSDTIRLIPSTK